MSNKSWLIILTTLSSLGITTAVNGWPNEEMLWRFVSSFILLCFVIGFVFVILRNLWLWQKKQDAKLETKLNKKEETSLLFLPPKHRYELTWDPITNLQVITRPSDKTVTSYRLPIFRLKNLGKEVVKTINVEWLIAEDLLGEKVANSERLKKYKTSIQNNSVSIEKTKNNRKERWTNYISFNEVISYEYLAPQIDNYSFLEINMPGKIYGVLEIIFVAEMSNGPSISNQVSKKFDVNISYNENGKNIKNMYKVIATARSSKPWSNGVVKIPIDGKMREPPEIMAEVKFNVTQ